MKHEIFHKPITTMADAEAFLTYLFDNGLSYHCEDSAADCIGEWITGAEAIACDKRMDECYQLDWPADQDPCGFVLELDADYLSNGIGNRDHDMGLMLRVADDLGLDIDHDNYREIWADKVRLENLLAAREPHLLELQHH